MNCEYVLIDTDIGPDCDDVAAIAMLNLYELQGKCKILGIGHCTSNPYGAGTVDAICKYYGHSEVPLGTFKGESFLTDEKCKYYNEYITKTLPNRYRDTQPENAVTMYRRVLSQQEDKSVLFIAIGPLNNLAALLESEPDEFSPLTGTELVARKVKRLVAMAGIFPCGTALADRVYKISEKTLDEFPEFNVVCDAPAAIKVANDWPTPKEYLGFEAGLIETCKPLQERLPENHPVRIAYHLYTENGARFSWDLFTVQYAIDPNCGNYVLSADGQVRFDEEGHTFWKELENGNDHYVIWNKAEEEIANSINELLASYPS